VGTTMVLPMLSFLTMKLTKTIGSLHLLEKEERLFPFAMISFLYVMATYLFYIKLSVDPTLVFTLATITICVVLLTAITFFWKISAHMTGISGLLSIIAVSSLKYPNSVFIYPMLLVLLLSGVLASSRLYLNAHTQAEVLGGFLLGFCVCFISFYYFLG
jgi:membrane-associated phospholipid phosphatase